MSAVDAIVERVCIALEHDWRTWHGHAFANRYDRVGVPSSWDVLALLGMMLEPVLGTSKDRLPLWSPTVYGPAYRERGQLVCRRSSNTVSVSMVVLDVDDGTSLDQLLEPGAFALAHTSWSHTPAHPKWRVVYPLAEPVPAQRWAATWRGLAAKWPAIDPATKDPARMYYVPAVRERAPLLCPGPSPLIARRGTYTLRVQLGAWLTLPAPIEEAPAPVTRKAPAPYRPDTLRRDVAAQLRTDPAARERVAELVGARIMGGRARHAPCPACHRPAVWFALVPTGAGWAYCNHRQSCGWTGPLDELARVTA